MDSKLSQYPVATMLQAGDLIPIVRSGANFVITAGVASLNQPNVGNAGITKNAVNTPTTGVIPVTATLVSLPNTIFAYTLAGGSPGQELKIVAPSAGTYTVTTGVGADFTSAVFTLGSSLSLVFVGTKWIVTASRNCTIT